MKKGKKETIIVFSAHSDDFVIGAGGTIAKYVQEGNKVISVVFSKGEKSHPWLKVEVVQEFRVEEIGEDRFVRITVPPDIWFGFQGLHAPQSLLLNIANIPHDLNEVERLALTDINYDWN